MIFEIIKLPIVPNGDMPTLHFSQADNGREFGVQLIDTSGEIKDPTSYLLEFHLRKVDDTIVTLTSAYKLNNATFFRATEQFCACVGQNLGEVVIMDPLSDTRLGTLNCFVNVERDPLINGITSESEIHYLRGQIEAIAGEVIGEDYYNKTAVDGLLALKADASELPDMTKYYKKTETDSLLANKADVSDLPDMSKYYKKTETDSLLANKADVSDLPDMTDYYTKTAVDYLLAYKADIEDLPDMSQYYTKSEVDDIIDGLMPIATASGNPCTFETELDGVLVSCKAEIVATGGGGTPDSPIPIEGYTEANITANGETVTIAFGQTVYGGVLDVTKGKLTVTWGSVDLGSLNWSSWEDGSGLIFNAPIADKVHSSSIPSLCSIYTWNSNVYVWSDLVNYQMTGSGANNYLYIRNNEYLNKETFKEAMSGVIVAYELATPIDIDITPEVISAILGENNIISDVGGAVSVEYKDTIQHYIDNKE